MMKAVLWAIIGLLVYVLFVMLLNAALSKAHAVDLFHLVRPEGFEGEGHAENHAHYQGLKSPDGHLCCSGTDCRPTVARFDGARWWVKVNGAWRDDFSTSKVLNDTWLRSEQRRLGQPVTGRWNTEAHVCASLSRTPFSIHPATIYCVILSDEWN